MCAVSSSTSSGGDPALFDDGARDIENRTGWASLGLVPHFIDANQLPAEDSVDLSQRLKSRQTRKPTIRIAVLRLQYIANFDDLDPLRLEPEVDIQLVEPGQPIAGDVDLVILPGSKSTLSDLAVLRQAGWQIDISAHVRRGGHVLGLCGGFQMMGKTALRP